jgi:hypothetical protein
VIKLQSFAYVLPVSCLFTFVELALRRGHRRKVTVKLVHEGSWCVQMARYKGRTSFENNGLENKTKVKKIYKNTSTCKNKNKWGEKKQNTKNENISTGRTLHRDYRAFNVV